MDKLIDKMNKIINDYELHNTEINKKLDNMDKKIDIISQKLKK